MTITFLSINMSTAFLSFKWGSVLQYKWISFIFSSKLVYFQSIKSVPLFWASALVSLFEYQMISFIFGITVITFKVSNEDLFFNKYHNFVYQHVSLFFKEYTLYAWQCITFRYEWLLFFEYQRLPLFQIYTLFAWQWITFWILKDYHFLDYHQESLF